MKYILTILVCSIQFHSFSQATLNINSDNRVVEKKAQVEYLFIPPLVEIKSKLSNAPRYDEDGMNWVKIKIPFADGTYHEVEMAEAPVVAEAIYNRYPENRSYKVRGVNDKYISGRMSITPEGMTAMLFTKSSSLFIEPTDSKYHKAYNFDGSTLKSFSCGTDHSQFKNKEHNSVRTSIGADERKYIIAIASTGEFSIEHGNNLATINAEINNYLTLLNTLYERDLAITFELTADNDDIIFFNASTDGLDPTNTTTQLNTAQSVINNEIGSGNYDIGHVFYEMPPPPSGWWGSGVGGIGVVCTSNLKARGWTGCGGNYPNSFWMEIFAHEVGHQFSATHTFYGTADFCGGSQRSIGNGVEPGSGNSTMSYEATCGASGSCSDQNITPESSFQYFHSHSIDQIQNYVSGSGNCFTSTSSGNSPPTIMMPTSKTIPKGTPFFLTATVTDPDGDPLLSAWEEVDTDNLDLSCPDGAPNDAATSTTAPLFRSFDPSADGETRYFPQLSDILDDTQTMGEILPEVGRTIDMRFIARGTDPNGISGVSYEDVSLTVDGNSGPFEIITGNTATAYLIEEIVDVEWSVANTDLAPVSCSHVNILFSSDGGESFPTVLASNVQNDGLQEVNMPSVATEEGRIKIEAVGNIFFSINKEDISIIDDCSTNSSSILYYEDVVANAGDPILDLDLIIGEKTYSISGEFDSSDPNAKLIAENSLNGACATFASTPYYETFLFTLSEIDTYTFDVSGSIEVSINFYENEYITPLINCQNWIASNYTVPPLILTNPYSISLNEGDVFELVISALNTGETGTYNIDFSNSGFGSIINLDIVPTGFDYKFVIRNSNGLIIDIVDDADLSDGTVYYNNEYTIKGLMVFGTIDLTPYIGYDFSILENDVITGSTCGEFSSNEVFVKVNGCVAGNKTVSSILDDGGVGTLRYWIDNVCAGDIIEFDAELLDETIVLNSEILIEDDLIINGLGIDNITISGNNASRIFSIDSGISLTLNDLTLINGFASSNGGAFINLGALALENIRFKGNKNGLNAKAFTNLGNITIRETVNIEE